MIAPGIRLREETAEDETFLRRLFFSTRQAEFAPLGLGEAQLTQLLDSQFDLQRTHFRTMFRDADWWIVERRRDPIGRLYVGRDMGVRTIIDIALLPEWSGQGIGGALIDHALAEAKAAGRPVTLHVRPYNPARRLYLRKGFVETGVEGADIAMRWDPRARTQ